MNVDKDTVIQEISPEDNLKNIIHVLEEQVIDLQCQTERVMVVHRALEQAFEQKCRYIMSLEDRKIKHEHVIGELKKRIALDQHQLGEQSALVKTLRDKLKEVEEKNQALELWKSGLEFMNEEAASSSN